MNNFTKGGRKVNKMRIDIQDLITLNDKNQYVVCSKINYHEKEYLYLIDITNNQNFKFARIETQENMFKIFEIQNEHLIQTLLPLFYKNSKNILNDTQ